MTRARKLAHAFLEKVGRLVPVLMFKLLRWACPLCSCRIQDVVLSTVFAVFVSTRFLLLLGLAVDHHTAVVHAGVHA